MIARSKALRALVAILVIGVVCALLQGCSDNEPAQREQATPSSNEQPLQISPEVKGLRGSIVDSQPVDNPSPPLADLKSKQFKVVYRSVSGIDGSSREVSGTVVVPAGPPPAGGWPIIAYGHGMTGICLLYTSDAADE